VEDYRPVVAQSAHPHSTGNRGVESSKNRFFRNAPGELRLGRPRSLNALALAVSELIEFKKSLKTREIFANNRLLRLSTSKSACDDAWNTWLKFGRDTSIGADLLGSEGLEPPIFGPRGSCHRRAPTIIKKDFSKFITYLTGKKLYNIEHYSQCGN
jgi:hypothetical protein